MLFLDKTPKNSNVRNNNITLKNDKRTPNEILEYISVTKRILFFLNLPAPSREMML